MARKAATARRSTFPNGLRRLSVWLGVGLLSVLVGGGRAGWAEAAAGEKLPVLLTANAVHSLTAAEAARVYPVRVRGVVTYYDPRVDPRRACIFLHDASGGIFVSLGKGRVAPVHAGTEVEVDGVSQAGDFAPIILASTIRVLGESAMMPWAEPAILPMLMTGSFDARWVEVEGVVQAVLGSRWNIVLKLSTPTGVLRATTLRQEGVDYNRLVDARVRIKANVAPQLNQRHQVTGAHLYFPGMEDVTTEVPAPADTFGGPRRPVSALFQYEPGMRVLHSVHVRGRVTLYWPGRHLCIEDASGGLCVDTSQQETLAVGELVDVVGFATVENSSTSLSEARFKKAGDAVPVTAVRSSAAAALQGEHTGELVTMEGKLISTTWGVNAKLRSPTLMLEDEGHVFSVTLQASSPATTSRLLALGSTLAVTGVCLTEVDGQSGGLERDTRYASFRILLRSPDDVRLMKAPSWWNAAHTVTVLLLVLMVGMAVCGWVIVLRRRVDEQTQVIRRSEERFRHLAQHDGLTGLANRTLLHERLEEALHESKLRHTPIAVLMMDLDNFKQVNDRYGHHAGDMILCEAANRLNASVRRQDTVARMGGDEFVVLLSSLGDVREAAAIAAKIVAAIAAPFEIEGQLMPMYASIGVCTHSGGGGKSVATLLRNCDTALYGAKALGRNCWQEFTGTKVEEQVVGGGR